MRLRSSASMLSGDSRALSRLGASAMRSRVAARKRSPVTSSRDKKGVTRLCGAGPTAAPPAQTHRAGARAKGQVHRRIRNNNLPWARKAEKKSAIRSSALHAGQFPSAYASTACRVG